MKRMRDWSQGSQMRNNQRVLYKEWEEKYQRSVESESLNKRKQALELIRQMKRPISKEELEEHMYKYEDEREKLLEMKRQQREEKMMEIGYDVDRYRTKTYEEVALYDLQMREEKDTKEEMKRLLIEKKENYARYVKEMHLPLKSQRKERELIQLKEGLKHPVREAKKYPPGDKLEGYTRTNTSMKHTRANSMSGGEDEEEYYQTQPNNFNSKKSVIRSYQNKENKKSTRNAYLPPKPQVKKKPALVPSTSSHLGQS